MYEGYWKLRQRPFESGADPRVYYPGEAHQGALMKLRYAVEQQHAAALLTGAAGTGKTLLARVLAQHLPERFQPVVQIVFPQMPSHELLAYLAVELGAAPADARPTSIAESVGRIHRKLLDQSGKGRHTVVVIDEAQLLDGGRTFETLRLLSNLEASGRPLLTLVLSGQPALLPMFERMPHLEERLGAKCLLRPLTVEETLGYVTHRMTAAGAKRAIFEQTALETLFEITRGIPRRINRLCDLALLIGFAEEQETIQPAHIEAVSRELAVAAVE
jgi:type II secretory pathway predicted ATPase ExeA